MNCSPLSKERIGAIDARRRASHRLDVVAGQIVTDDRNEINKIRGTSLENS